MNVTPNRSAIKSDSRHECRTHTLLQQKQNSGRRVAQYDVSRAAWQATLAEWGYAAFEVH